MSLLRGTARGLNDVRVFSSAGALVRVALEGRRVDGGSALSRCTRFFFHVSRVHVALSQPPFATQLSQIPLRRQDKVFRLGWTSAEHLVVVYETAFVELYVPVPKQSPSDTRAVGPASRYRCVHQPALFRRDPPCRRLLSA